MQQFVPGGAIKNSEILIDVPEKLETERLILRCPALGDGSKYLDFASECFNETKQWFGPWAGETPNQSQCEALVRTLQIDFIRRAELNYFVFLKGSDEIMGRAFVSKLDWKVRKGMLGYWTRTSRHREGLGYEVLQALKRLIFDSLHFRRLDALIDPRNEASQKLAEKAGFQFEGRLKNYTKDNFGILHDFLSYSIIPCDLDFK